MTLLAHARAILPPVLLALLKRFSWLSNRYSGPYSTWAEAYTTTSGYDADIILSRVVEATRAVVEGRAAFERDSVIFEKDECPFQILTPLLLAGLESQGRISVMDFGGALGSNYYRCRSFLKCVSLHWDVIEQKKFVTIGRAEFETPQLHFYEAAAEIPEEHEANVLLFSSVLQYLEKPIDSLRDASHGGVRYLVIDRTPFSSEDKDHICVQHVPKRIYSASYPLWVFSYSSLVTELSRDWSVVVEYECPEGRESTLTGLAFQYRGIILKRR